MITLFIYGTLLPNNTRAYVLKDCEHVGEDELMNYAMYDVGTYPAIVPYEGRRVKGQVVVVDANKLAELDWIESNGSLYQRKQVTLVSGKVVQTYVYLKSVAQLPEIPYDDQPYSNS